MACHNSRGQQGIGISASALYGQLTTGKPIKIISKIGPKSKSHYYELHINTKSNEPEIIKEEEREWEKDHGTKVQIELEGKYHKGKLSVDEFLQLTAISNPHATIIYKAPKEELPVEFPRATKELPKEAKEIKPHPYGIELGILIKMLKDTKSPTLQGFLQQDFCRISANVAKEICDKAGLYEKARPNRIARQEADNLFKVIQKVKIMSPPTDCISPIGEEQMLKGMKKEIEAEFYASITRPPSVYRGNPFQIEVCIAYGGSLPGDDLAKIIRYANRVPLQHQAGACAVTKSVTQTAWRNYGLAQSRGALPSGPVIIMVHMASVWVPFTSESKEAIASYPEIIKEVKLA
ncbi:MAG: DNA topoisomerase VI subunit B, partial [Nanoarchaeota archaeon]|nr:DNA topoisomerase VI subunit B [Nanoarchaeota archaeon]